MLQGHIGLLQCTKVSLLVDMRPADNTDATEAGRYTCNYLYFYIS